MSKLDDITQASESAFSGVWSNVGGTGGQFSRSHSDHTSLTSFTRGSWFLQPGPGQMIISKAVKSFICHSVWTGEGAMRMRMYSDFQFSFKESIWSDKHVYINVQGYREVRFKYSLGILIVFSASCLCLASLTLHYSTFLPVPYCAQTVAMIC